MFKSLNQFQFILVCLYSLNWVILSEPCCGKKIAPTEPTMVIVPVPMGERKDENKGTVTNPPIIIIPTPMEEVKDQQPSTKEPAVLIVPRNEEEDKENEIETQPDTLEKEEAKAEEEDCSMNVCQSSGNDNPELTKCNNHIKKDLQCEGKNDSREEDVTIGVFKQGKSKEVEDHAPRRRKQNWKRSISNHELAQYVNLLDKAMGYPYTKSPTFEINRQYNPWRQYTLDAITPPGVFPSYYN